MRPALLCGVSLAAALASAGAQAPDSSRADSARAIRAVTVTEARAAGTVGGASAVVVKVDELRASPAPLLEEALRESPFVHVRQNSRGEMELSIRGSDSRQAAVLVDGVPLTLGWDHRTDPSLIPITGAQNLVIIRGLGTLLSGPNSLGGTIEVSHDEVFGRLGSGRLWGGAGVDENSALVATAGAGREFEGVGSGTISIRSGVAHRQRDGFTLPKDAVDPTSVDGLRTNSDLRETDGFLSTRWRSAGGRSVGLMVAGFDAERGVPPEEHITGPRLWRYPYHSRAIASLSASGGTFATPFGYGTLDAGFGYNSGRLRIDSYDDRTYSSVDESELGVERTWTARLAASHTMPRDARLRAAMTFANVDYEETLPGASAADYRQQLLSGGAEVDIPLGARTTLATGAVYDQSATPLSGGRTPRQETFSSVGWRAGLTRDVNAELRLHASASRRSRFPALRELYSGALNRFAPNPDLKPETLLGFEAGFTLDRSMGPIPDATIQVNGFHHDLEDAVVRTTLPDNRFFRVNRDRVRSTGAELLAGFVFGSTRERAVSVTIDGMVQDIRILDQMATAAGYRHAENNPEGRGMLELGMPIARGMRAYANARHAGVQYCINGDTDAEMRLPATTETNLALERRWSIARRGSGRFLRALLAFDNVGDVAIYDQCGLPQPGRTLRLMLTVQ